MAETARRREKQQAYNEAHGITPETIRRQITDIVGHLASKDQVTVDTGIEDRPHMVGHNLRAYIEELEAKMRAAAADLEFEEAAACATRSGVWKARNWASPPTSRSPRHAPRDGRQARHP